MKSPTGFANRLLYLGLCLATAGSTGALAQAPVAKAKAAPPPSRTLLAINEGGAANADATETLLKYQEFVEIIEKTLRTQVVVVAVRDPQRLRAALKKHEHTLLLSRPSDVASEAVRDHGYQPVVMARESARTIFIVNKNSPLQTIASVRGRTIVTPDQYSHMWRVASAMLRDSNIIMANEQVKAMRDQAAIGWSMDNGFFDVGVINSISAIGRNWEKNGGRIIAKSRELPNMPLIAAPQMSEEQVQKLRAAVINLDASDAGKAILKKIGVPSGFQTASSLPFLEFIAWIGDLEAAKNAALP
jgi:phosphonate transport system substrate-binding protein